MRPQQARLSTHMYMLLVVVLALAAAVANAAVFSSMDNARPNDGLVELAPFVPPVAYDNLDGGRTIAITTPSTGALLVHANYLMDPRCYTERVVDSRLTSPGPHRPLARLSYTSKRLTKSYKSGQGLAFKTDFDNATMPTESEGFCERELSAFDKFTNSQRDACGRVVQQSANVTFLVQIDVVEPGPNASTLWSWYVGLPFRNGNGGVVIVDNQVAQELSLGVASDYWAGCTAKMVRVNTLLTPGRHVIQVYGHAVLFESAAIYFSRGDSTAVPLTVAALIDAVTQWTPMLDADANTATAVAKERNTNKNDVTRRVSSLSIQRIAVAGQYILQLRGVANPNCRVASPFNTSSRVSATYLPTASTASSRTVDLVMAVPRTAAFTSIPGATTTVSRGAAAGVMMVFFTGRFFVDDTTAKAFTLDLACGFNQQQPTGSQFRLDQRFIQPSGSALDFSALFQAPTGGTTSGNMSAVVYFLYAGTAAAKIIGARVHSLFLFDSNRIF